MWSGRTVNMPKSTLPGCKHMREEPPHGYSIWKFLTAGICPAKRIGMDPRHSLFQVAGQLVTLTFASVFLWAVKFCQANVCECAALDFERIIENVLTVRRLPMTPLDCDTRTS